MYGSLFTFVQMIRKQVNIILTPRDFKILWLYELAQEFDNMLKWRHVNGSYVQLVKSLVNKSLPCHKISSTKLIFIGNS